MKGIKFLILLLLCMTILSACSNNEKKQSNTGGSTATAQPNVNDSGTAEPKLAAQANDKSDAAEDEDRLASSEESNLIQEALFNTMSVHSLSFSTKVEEITTFASQADSVNDSEHAIYSTYSGTIERDPARASFELKRDVMSYELQAENLEMVDEYEQFFVDYFDEESRYGISSYDEVWYKSDTTESFRTIERLEEIIEFYAEHSDNLSISDYEGKISLDLELTPEQFADHIQLLTYTLFNGEYEKFEYEHMYDIMPELLEYNYTSLILDDSNHVAGYFVSFGSKTMDGAEDDRYTFFMMVSFTDLNEATAVVIPDEVVQGAVVSESFE